MLAVHGARRVPLAVPARVPLADLIDAVGAEVGAPVRVGGGLRATTACGRPLRPDTSLVEQGVVDGDLLVLLERQEAVDLGDPSGGDHAAGGGEGTTADVAAAVARLVEASAAARPASSPTPRLLVPAVALAGPAALLPTVPGGGALALAATACLLALAGVLGRAGSARALPAAVAACAHAAAAGAVLVPAAGGWLGLRLAVAGSAAALVGALALPLLRERRLLLLPVVALGVLLAVTALAARLTTAPPAAAVLSAAAFGVLVLPGLPRLAVGASGLARRLPDLGPVTALHAGGGPVPLPTTAAAPLAAEVRAAHDLLLTGHVTAAALLLVAAPVAVLTGPAGTALVLAGSTVLLTTASRWRDPGPARPAAAAGVAVLLALVAAVLVLQPGWRPVVAVTLLAVGSVALLAPTGGAAARARRARACERLEGTAVLVVLPLLAVASGAVDLAADAVLDLRGWGP
ncbi:EsaB/YukD family protein [Nocardioides perillae]|uniref:EccD-like transmembrane domain-containing protein n=1 Tax=Nocardioides perillae TaxID=1119534 RepID=A0A7Y9RSA6_9ACTN|nr:hypothetical protein [Nocardioides perillae]